MFYDWARRVMSQFKKLRALHLAIKDHQWQITLMLRLIPSIPMAIKNYGLSTVEITFSCYFWCTLISHIPFSILWSWIGSSSTSLSGEENEESNSSSLSTEATWALLGLSLFLVIIFSVYMNRKVNHYLREKSQQDIEMVEVEDSVTTTTENECNGDQNI